MSTSLPAAQQRHSLAGLIASAPAFLLGIFLTLSTLSVQAQCPCTPVFTVGSGTPYPNMTAASILPGFATPGAVCIRIIGQFDIDATQTWNLSGTSVIFANTTSSIFVLSGGALNAQSSTFQPCSTGWLGVYVQTGGSATVSQCTFDNADNAGISAVANSTFHITGSFFNNCNKGVKITGQQSTANHTLLNNRFNNCNTGISMGAARDVLVQHNIYNGGGPGSMTGIHLESICEDIEVQNGSFNFLYRGISSVKTVNLEIAGSFFQSCETGIFSAQGSNVLLIDNCDFSRVILGIHVWYHDTNADKGDMLIEDNEFIAQVSQDNILVDDLGGSGKGTIQNNIINLPNAAVITQYGIEVQQAYAKNGLFIEQNTLKYGGTGTTAPGGIFVNDSKEYCLIRNNVVQHTGIGVNAANPMPFGIRALDCSTAIEIIGNSTDGGSVISDKGICVEDCPDEILLCCNNLTRSYIGLYIKGSLNGSLIFNTTFGNHPFAALYYDQITSTGAPQVNHGNDWSGASGTWDAYFNGSPGVANIVNYVVNIALLPNGLSNIFVTGGTASDWFAINHDTEPGCVNSTISYCGETPGRPGEGGGDGGHERSYGTVAANAFFSVYPNPVDQVLNLVWQATSESSTEVFLHDNLGRIVLRQQAAAGTGTLTLPVGSLSPGMYWLEVRQAGNMVNTSKVLIQH